jgi:hypothetical protein
MARSSNSNVLDQIAKFFLLLSDAPLYWFTLNTSCDHAFHLSKRLGMEHNDYKALLVAAATAAATALLPPSCHRHAVSPRCSTAAKLLPTSRCPAAATASPPPSCRQRPLSRCRRRPLLRCRHRRSCRRAAAAAAPLPSCHRHRAVATAAATAAVCWLVVALLAAV